MKENFVKICEIIAKILRKVREIYGKFRDKLGKIFRLMRKFELF